MTEETRRGIRDFFSSVNHYIVVLNIIIFLLTDLILFPATAEKIVETASLNHTLFFGGEYYRLFTYMFLHGDISHIMGNMMMIFFLGDTLERHLGKVRYLILYFSTGILAGVASMVYNILSVRDAYSIGASGAGFGLMGALLALLMMNHGRMDGINITRILLYVALSLYTGIRSTGIDNAAHVGGLAAGLVIGMILALTLQKRRATF